MAYKNYRNDYDNLNSWLSRVPNYEPRDTDDPNQVETKLRNQRVRMLSDNSAYFSLHMNVRGTYLCSFLQNLLSDLARKESDLNNVSKNAQLYQQAVKVSFSPLIFFIIWSFRKVKGLMVVYWFTLQDYETEAEKFKSILDLEDGLVPQTYKRSRLESPAATVKAEVRHSMHGEAQFKHVANCYDQHKSSSSELIFSWDTNLNNE